MAVKRGLGKGLDALIPQKKEEKSQQAAIKENTGAEVKLKISSVEPNREQPRKKFDEDALQELADSIKLHGVIQPIVVQDRKDYYEIISGERRWRASKLAGLKEIPAVVRNFSEQEIVEISLIENIQREDLNPIEEALAYKRLIEEFNLKQDEIAQRVSKSRSAVANSMRLLKLSPEVQQMVIDDMISTGHARALLAIEDAEEQYKAAQQVFDEKLSVRDIEKMVKNLAKKPKEKAEPVPVSVENIYNSIAEELKNHLGTKVSINAKNNGTGKIEIEFYSRDEFERLMEILKK